MYAYDAGGNITGRKTYDYTTGELGAQTGGGSYSYENENWKDLLTGYDGQVISYDEIGNPLSYRDGMEYTWEGRQLKTASAGGKDIGYAYNSDGVRTGRTVDGVATSYFLDGSTVIAQKTGDDVLWFLYDSDGTRVGFTYNGAAYYYTENAQGDVTGIVDKDCNTVVEYSYDAWGKLLGTTGSLAGTVGKINPFLYRGYYYDAETGLYYLNSRYYDPQTGRFLNADSSLNPGTGLNGMNMFVYCNNNSANMADNSGHFPFLAVTAIIGAAVGAVAGGIIAAKTGHNVWAGIGIGAAGGALLGLGIGAGLAMISGASAGVMATAGEVGAGLLTVAATQVDNIVHMFNRAVPAVTEATQTVSQSARTLYQVTSKVNATQIAETGKIISQEGGRNSLVYALNFQPTLAQAQELGARSIETVIKFSTNAGFGIDKTCAIDGALRSVLNGPINVFDVIEVGFK